MKALAVGDCRASYHCVRDGVEAGAFELMPYSARVLAECVLRNCAGEERDAALRQIAGRRRDEDVPFFPARVVLQDLLGAPVLVDLAGLREAVAEAGGDPLAVNPRVPVQLVIDHSLSVERSGSRDAMAHNMEIERRRNAERFEFLDWCRRAFSNVAIVPPGNGILHQINLETLSPVVCTTASGEETVAFPDTLVGTDSHTPMINALGVLGWGVGGIEAEAVMLGRPVLLRIPEIVGVELRGRPGPGILATDIALALTEWLRTEGVVGRILEFVGEGAAELTVPDRATVSNMAPEYGATAAMFPIDEQTIAYLRLTGRAGGQCRLVETYARAAGLWAGDLVRAEYDRRLTFDLGSVGRAIAGPRVPHQRIPIQELRARGIAGPRTSEREGGLHDGAVVIAAITSCTNTSNPRAMVAAGLLARNARRRGLRSAPWVKTSLAPGSRAVLGYLQSAGLYQPLRELGFDVVGFACTTCNGMSGPLDEPVAEEIREKRLAAAAVLSGNRNFEGRIHPLVREAFIASPPLVVAYAIAGSIRTDVHGEPLGEDGTGRPVLLEEIWPDDSEIDEVVRAHVTEEVFIRSQEGSLDRGSGIAPGPAGVHGTPGDARGISSGAEPSPMFRWDEGSTYLRRPPYWEARLMSPPGLRAMRPIAILGDNITTDHISPSGAIEPGSAAGRFLLERGVTVEEFNYYGTRRGNHEIGIRATFASTRLRNEMVAGTEGSFTRLQPEGRVVPLFDAALEYMTRGQPLVVIAGINYGCGSSRDWAAKGVRLIGVSAVIAESFERIHRSNLAALGVLPLEFAEGVTRHALGLDGSETLDVEGADGADLAPRAELVLRVARQGGEVLSVPVRCRLDTDEEVQYFRAGGLLPLIYRRLLDARRGKENRQRT